VHSFIGDVNKEQNYGVRTIYRLFVHLTSIGKGISLSS